MVQTVTRTNALAEEIDSAASSGRLSDRGVAGRLAAGVKDLALHDLTGAIDLAERFVRAAGPGTPAQADALAALGHAECYAGRFESALAHLRHAISILELAGPPSALAGACAAAVQSLARLGRLDEAQHTAERALELHTAHSSAFDAARAGVNLAIVLRMRGLPEEALARFDLSEPGLAHHGVAMGAMLSNRAEALLDLDRFTEARRSFERAVGCFEAAGAAHARAITLGNIADLLGRLGRPHEALERTELARAAFEGVGAGPDVARLACEEAEMLAAIGARDAAIDRLREWTPRLEQAGLARESARARLSLGLLLVASGHPGEADEVLRAAEPALRQCGLEPLAAEARAGIGLSLAASGDAPGALATLRDAAEFLRAAPVRRARVLLHAASVALDARLQDEATRALDEARTVLDAVDILPLRATALALHTRRARLRGAMGEAADRAAESIRAIEELREATPFLEARAGVGASRQGAYLDAAGAFLDRSAPGDDARAFDALERMRARTLAPVGTPTTAEADAESPTLRAARAEHLEAASQLSAVYSELGVNPARAARGAPSSAVHRAGELERRCELLRQRLAQTAGTLPSLSSPLGLDAVCASLAPHEGIVAYFAEDDTLSAQALTGGAVRVARGFARVSDAARAIERLRFIADRVALTGRWAPADESHWDGALLALRRLVWDPIGEMLAPSALAIVPFGPLHGLPWPALLGTLPVARRPPSVVTAPSATAAVLRAAPPEHEASHGALIVGVADDSAPRAEHEARAVAGAARDATLLTARDATAQRVLDHMRHADLLHLATHCVFDPERPMSSRLRLADRWCTAREFLGRVRPGAAIVLAGCQTGRSSDRTGEDRFGLARAFLASGARAVVASHWPLHDAAAEHFFPRFHAELARGVPVSQALTMLVHADDPSAPPRPLRAGLFVKGSVSC
ncbi:MAG TPA: hypothetical protein DEB06_09885 [Phycisphaerales bacterium]|nr:hypothetical protein [Phycisphaerales bacterium]